MMNKHYNVWFNNMNIFMRS